MDWKPRGPDFKGSGYAVWIEGDTIKLKHDAWAKAVVLNKTQPKIEDEKV